MRKSKGGADTNCANEAYRDGHDRTFGEGGAGMEKIAGQLVRAFQPKRGILDKIDRLIVYGTGIGADITDPKDIYLGYTEMMAFRAAVKAWKIHDCQAKPDEPPRYNGIAVYEVKAEKHLVVA